MKSALQVRVELYALAGHMTADQVLLRDGNLYPKGEQFAGFLAWMEEGKRRFKEEHPEHFLGDAVTSQTAFTKFLQDRVKDHLGI